MAENKMEQVKELSKAERMLDMQNKMAEVARLFGKKLGERFTVRYINCLYDCTFADCGFIVYSAYDDFDVFLLQALLIGRAVIVDE